MVDIMLRRHFINISYSKDIKPNEIWYKTSNGEKFDYQLLIDTVVEQSNRQQLTLLKKNYLINDGWWCLTFTNNIAYTGFSETETKIGPVFTGLFDGFGAIETNVLNIIEIKLPSIFFIEDSSFYGCVGLQFITIPESVTSIGERVFYGCKALKSLTIPEGITSIGEEAFYNCESLKSVTIPNSVTSIEEGVFRDCSSLTEIVIPNSVTSIGKSAFYDCSSLSSITIPNSVKSIGDYVFYGCTSLNSITFEGTIEQWNAITKGEGWNTNVPATVVHCTDGDVAL